MTWGTKCSYPGCTEEPTYTTEKGSCICCAEHKNWAKWIESCVLDFDDLSEVENSNEKTEKT